MSLHPTEPARWPSQTREAEAHRRRMIAYGRWEPYVDATRAREHVQNLLAANMGPVQIAKVSGVPHGAISKLLYGDYARGMAPSKRIRRETEAKLLAVEATVDTLADAALMPSLGTVRRIQALHALGWPLSEVARRIGVHRASLDRTLKAAQVQAGTARRVRGVYEELCMTPGPSLRARKSAAEKRWKPPLWWDDIDTDFTLDKRVRQGRAGGGAA